MKKSIKLSMGGKPVKIIKVGSIEYECSGVWETGEFEKGKARPVVRKCMRPCLQVESGLILYLLYQIA